MDLLGMNLGRLKHQYVLSFNYRDLNLETGQFG